MNIELKKKSQRRFNILVTSSINKTRPMLAAKVGPLVACENVQRVFFVSDTPGNEISGVSFFSAPRILRHFRLLGPIWRMFFIPWLCMRERVHVIVGMFTEPHGIIALLCAKLTRRLCVISLMGGAPEVYYKGELFESFLLAILRRTNMTTINGEAGLEYLLHKGLKRKRTCVLSCVVDTHRFKPIDIAKQYDVIFVGRLASVKRVDILLRALSQVRKVHKGIRAAIVGDGPLRTELEELAHNLNIHSSVSFLGWQENTEFYFNVSKIFILTSESEGLSLAMMEAMSCGLPVIVPDVGDTTSLAVSGYNSIVISQPTVTSFADAIVKLLEDKKLYTTLSNGAIHSIRNGKTMAHGAQIWSDILNQIAVLP